MVKRFWVPLGLSLLGAWITMGGAAQGNPGTPPGPDPVAAEAQYQQHYQTYTQLLDQVSSINQFRDVSPTEWSFEALRNLVENYGCIVGYPDRTFRGDRPLTRNEFAAGLSACLTQLEQRMMASKRQLDSVTQVTQPAVPPGDTLENVFTRGFYHNTGRFYDITSISGQANKIFGWRSWPGSFFDNMIAEDAGVVEAIYDDALRQQTAGTALRTQDLPNPFGESLRTQPSYTRFGNPELPPRQFWGN